MTGGEGVGPRVTVLRFAAADMATGGAQPEVPGAAAFLAAIGLGRGRGRRDVLTGSGAGGVGKTSNEVHARSLHLDAPG